MPFLTTRRPLQAWLFLLLFILWLTGKPDPAHADGAVRVEWMKGGNVLSAETVTSTGASAASAAAPSFGGVSGQARISVTSGAVIVYCCAASPTATQTNGVRLQAGDQPYIFTGVPGALKIAIIEATDPPAGGGASGGGDASAANQTVVEAVAGSNASKAVAVQGITGGKAIATTIADGGDASEGLTTDGACAGDATSGCTMQSRLIRLAQRTTSLIAAVGSPFQAGGSIGNTAFGISGNLPAFASTPTFNLGTLNGASLAAKQDSEIASLGNLDTNLGAKTDGACAGDATSGCSVQARIIRLAQHLTTLEGYVDGLEALLAAATPAGTNVIGKLGDAGGPIGDVGTATFGGAGAACTTLTLPGTGGTYAGPASAIVNGDAVLNNATAGSVTNQTCTVARYATGPFTLTGVRMLTSNTTITNASFRVHFYTTAPTFTNGNDGVLLTPHAGHVCAMDVTLGATSGGQVFSDGADGFGVPVAGTSCSRVLTSGQVIYPVIEARGAYAWSAAQTINLFPQGFN